MTRLIVNTKVTGQLGNRLQVHAHLMAAALENQCLLVNPCLAAYSHYFSGTLGNPWGRHDSQRRSASWTITQGLAYTTGLACWQIAKPSFVRRLGLQALRGRNEEFIDLPSAIAALSPQRWWLLATRGLHLYAPTWVAKHADAIRHFFTPLEPWRSQAEKCAILARGTADLLVGVHIRHGDYAQHHGGRWFYPTSIYADLMRQVVQLHTPRRVHFLVCGNAHIGPTDFTGLPVTRATGHLVEDLHALAHCDLIMGPPSSFSGWAAFYGNKRLYFIDDPQHQLNRDDFLLATAPDGGAHGADRSGGEAAARRRQ